VEREHWGDPVTRGVEEMALKAFDGLAVKGLALVHAALNETKPMSNVTCPLPVSLMWSRSSGLARGI
jgi:hypothetical protein